MKRPGCSPKRWVEVDTSQRYINLGKSIAFPQACRYTYEVGGRSRDGGGERMSQPGQKASISGDGEVGATRSTGEDKARVKVLISGMGPGFGRATRSWKGTHPLLQ